jgi:bifunctional DNA-binding transcriptional regulator/antitoxin component of YhaV-PrlF toxin-antitoxin module
MPSSTISAEGSLEIPEKLRQKYGLTAGTQVEFVEQDHLLAIAPIPDEPVETPPGTIPTEELLTDDPSKELPIDLGDLTYAMSDGSGFFHTYLDRETGEVVTLSEETMLDWERACEAWAELDEDQRPEFADFVAQQDLKDWQRDDLLTMERIELGHGSRYIEVHPANSRDGYRDMEHFIETVRDQRLYDRLLAAINRRRPFRQFKVALDNYPNEITRWRSFSQQRQEERAIVWLAMYGIKPVPPSQDDDEDTSKG